MAEPAATPPSTDPAAPPAPAAPEPKPDAPATFDPSKLQLPEGFKADDAKVAELGALLADDKLTPQERGQKLFDLYTSAVKEADGQAMKAWNDTNAEWQKAVKAHPEFGGAKFDATKLSIARMIDSLGGETATSLREALNATGAGNHPAVWAAFAKLAAKVPSEGTHVTGNPPAAPPDLAKEFFPNSAEKMKAL